jgi:hypothetical protein
MRSIAQFSQDLRRLPRVLSQKVATAAAPVLTELANKTFDAGTTAAGEPWKPGKKGQKITLRKSGDLAKYIHYVAIGTKLRVALGVAYAKYQVGKRPIFPTQYSKLPDTYVQALERVAVRVVKEELHAS